ncbi:MAG: hypothetical protein ACU85U_13920 [Gammaproteobacteria bacterium]|jgi:hypothetical protein
MRARTVAAGRAFATLGVVVLFSCSALANSSRLTVVNQVLTPVSGASSTIELYLSRLGTYYAELYLEREDESAPSLVPVDIGLSLRFLRGEAIVFERDVEARFEAGQAVTTILFLDIPRDLPQRKALALVVSLHHIEPAFSGSAVKLRLQLTRKVQRLPLRR